jgi:hypothetical protein
VESRLGIEAGTLAFLDGEYLHGVFGIVGGGDRKDVSSLVRMLIVPSLTVVSRKSSLMITRPPSRQG